MSGQGLQSLTAGLQFAMAHRRAAQVTKFSLATFSVCLRHCWLAGVCFTVRMLHEVLFVSILSGHCQGIHRQLRSASYQGQFQMQKRIEGELRKEEQIKSVHRGASCQPTF